MTQPAKPVVLLRPAPQKRDRIFTPAALARLNDVFSVIDLEDAPDARRTGCKR
jgi:hypothetical protein